jgi:hypothetical protein
MPTPKLPDAPVDAAAFGLLRAYLALQGVSQAQIREAIGGNPAGRTRAEIVEQLRLWLKDRPKAG